MYEDLDQIAELKFAKEAEDIAEKIRDRLKDAATRFAAIAGSGIRSGQHEASLVRIRIEGAVEIAEKYVQIWVDLVKQRNGCITRADLPFLLAKIEKLVKVQKASLRMTLAEQSGAALPSLIEEAEMRMQAVSGSARRDLEIMAREHEAFPTSHAEGKEMKQHRKKRFSPGRRVLVGIGMRPATVQSVAEVPSVMGEFAHQVLIDGETEARPVLGSDLQPLPELDEDLRGAQQVIHIESSNIANLNLGSQIGTINSALQVMSKGEQSQREFARALEEFTAAVLDSRLSDANKQEVVEALSTIAQQGTRKPEERTKGILKALVIWIPTAIATAVDLTKLWDKFGPAIKAYLGI